MFTSDFFFFFFNAEKRHLTLHIWAVQRVLPHSQHTIPMCRFLFKQIVHTLVIDLQIAGTKTKCCILATQPKCNVDVLNTE